jgi:hypothetical protein
LSKTFHIHKDLTCGNALSPLLFNFSIVCTITNVQQTKSQKKNIITDLVLADIHNSGEGRSSVTRTLRLY